MFLQVFLVFDYEKAQNIFKKTWVGSEFSLGEREKYEMKLCFGESKDPDFFIKNDSFATRLIQEVMGLTMRDDNPDDVALLPHIPMHQCYAMWC